MILENKIKGQGQSDLKINHYNIYSDIIAINIYNIYKSLLR